MNEILQEMWHTWTEGGWVMVAMVLLAAGHVCQRGARLLMAAVSPRPDQGVGRRPARLGGRPEAAPAAIARTGPLHAGRNPFRCGISKAVSARWRPPRSRSWTAAWRFSTCWSISAPLFGLLGTVLGMLLTFKAIGIGGSSTSEIIAKGISEALVATQTGMMVAIPGLVMAMHRQALAQRIRRVPGAPGRHHPAPFPSGVPRHDPRLHAREDVQAGAGRGPSGTPKPSARMKIRRTLAEPEESIELNLIPLIDIIMFLLIFFISHHQLHGGDGRAGGQAASRQRRAVRTKTTIILSGRARTAKSPTRARRSG